MPGFRRAEAVLFAATLSLSPATLPAQTWELQVTQVTIDHDPHRSIADTGEQVPPGFGVSLSREVHLPNLFLEYEYTRGVETRPGAVLISLMNPEENISENVEYSGGVSMLSMSYLGALTFWDALSIGFRPEVGFGRIRASEEGLDTGRTIGDKQRVVTLGLGTEAGVLAVPKWNLWVTVVGSYNYLHPIFVQDIDDGWQVFRHPLPQFSLGLGVRWVRSTRDTPQAMDKE